jgi:microcystin-dependent protein
MPSSYSPNLRIELIAPGEQAGTWGTTTNTNLGTLVEASIAGYVTVSVISANQAFTAANGAADQARNAIIELTTTTGANFAVYAPPESKQYTIVNSSAYTATVYNSTALGSTTAAGAGVAIPAGKTMTIFSDGENFGVQNTLIVSDVIGNVVGDVVGNASTATELETARQINGTSFDGSDDITTAKWGTARDISIGGTAKSVDGSTGVSWSVAEINANLPGEVAFYAMNSAPSGWLKANGAAVSRTTYAALFAAIGVTFGVGDGSTTFNLPDLRGEFIRGWDDGRGVDAGRVFGSAQSDAIREITGDLGVTGTGGRGGITTATGAFTSISSGGGIMDTTSSFSSTRVVRFSASTVVPTADENRPRNVALLACIKF